MPSLSELVAFVVISIMFFLGAWINGFIVLLQCITWVRNRKISFSDFIILNLALSRIILQGLPMAGVVFMVFYPHLFHVGLYVKFLDIFWWFTNNLSICLTTCLSVLYCLKIANFSNQAFLWLKRRVSHVVVRILVGSVFYSFTILALILKYHISSYTSEIKLSGNYTEEDKRIRTHYYLLNFLGTLWSLIPLSMSLTSSVLLILSLVRHTRHMKHHSIGTRDLSTMAHVRATKVILSSFILFIGYLLAFFLAKSTYFFLTTKMSEMIWSPIFIIYPSIQTFILILENQKLKQAFLRMFQVKKWWLKC
ncbi:taste receptor type 2 member 3-like [Gracilinanus agilis]|uniref:taste receptor type 2 member 3-like n=1 Tax=Gracilinanus agilis TaxID=191870 RepID=UPI001CFC5AA5|nr:taste receptor type 2 member 3-like [Gracilinanus agilis]XP_044541012.1 taste receptor type 2 member 3-like [Gracilinanus agilis]